MKNVDFTVALNSNQYGNSIGCGMCIKITGTGEGSGGDPIVGEHIVMGLFKLRSLFFFLIAFFFSK